MTEQKKLSWIPAMLFAAGSLAIIVFALFFTERFTETTNAHPFLMGFLKLFLLGTFGEMLKFRIVMRSWGLNKVIQRAVVWGVYGLWFTLAFPGFAALVIGLIGKGLWPGVLPGEGIDPTFLQRIWVAFSMSLWINLLGMFACGMFVSHEYFNYLIKHGWRKWSLKGFADESDPRFILAFLPKTLLFWIPAHTFTFAMPPEWRVFIAALLAIALGFFLSVGRRAAT